MSSRSPCGIGTSTRKADFSDFVLELLGLGFIIGFWSCVLEIQGVGDPPSKDLELGLGPLQNNAGWTQKFKNKIGP